MNDVSTRSVGVAREAEILAYQPAVDGLRAVAIVSVVAYHVGIPGFGNGFVGVDIFFVISGYLIINQIVAGLRKGNFRFAEFWARRALRILPPFLLVIAATLAFAPFVLVTPSEYAELGREAMYSALMVVNQYFLSAQGYFDTAADQKLLLHMWSLAVEEQFYLVVPLLLFALWRAGKWLGRWKTPFWVAVGASIFVASLAGCIAYTDPDKNRAFYLTQYRAWEFIVGGAVPLFVPLLRRLPRLVGEAIALAGAAAVLRSVYGFGDIDFPSYWALLPVLGTGVLILAAVARPETLVSQLLATRPFVWIGLVSYAWYLWHWPLITYGRIYNFSDRIFVWDVAAAGLSLGLAAATHLWLEVPIRRWRQRRRTVAQGWRIVFAGVASAVLVALVAGSFSKVVAPAVARSIAPGMWTKKDRRVTSQRPVCSQQP